MIYVCIFFSLFIANFIYETLWAIFTKIDKKWAEKEPLITEHHFKISLFGWLKCDKSTAKDDNLVKLGTKFNFSSVNLHEYHVIRNI